MATRRKVTPMMRQHAELKRHAADALLLFRMGDFYELFGEDAEIAAPLLDLTLTTRDRDTPDPIPMCGVPFHAVEGYIRKLLAAGHSVAIGEQTEDPKLAKGLVRREVTEIVTPGLVANGDRLEGADNNHLAAVIQDGEAYGLAFADVSTGVFAAATIDRRELLDAELDRLAPREVLVRDPDKALVASRISRIAANADFDPRSAGERLDRLPEGLAVDAQTPGARAAAAIWSRICAFQPAAASGLEALRHYRAAEVLLVDAATRRHLELFRNLQDGGRAGTLIERLDRTRTPMGRRRLVQWMGEPRVDLEQISARHDRVAAWLQPDSRRNALADALRGVGDLERTLVRAGLPASGPRELAALRDGLRAVARVAEVEPLGDVGAELCADLERTLVDEPPLAPRGEPYTGYIRPDVDGEVDRVRRETREAETYFDTLEAAERERTGISNLRVKYNRVFGYSIEVGKSKIDRVPADYRRKQTTANAERYVTDALERWEGLALRGREQAAAAEASALDRLRVRVQAQAPRVRTTAAAIAELDVAQSLARVAREYDYVRPELHTGTSLEIVAGRHPVVEAFVPDGFIPNDLAIGLDNGRVHILTGPNMAGKSTLLRQVGLIVLMAQMGSFVPADHARIGVADRIFTRVGASDSLTTGESTFMVEMRETAAILAEATPRSLVLLDEIGRGTSTFDGLSLAWAIAEFLHDAPGLQCRVLFATHYHELADLARTKSGVRNFHFSCAESGGDILFLRRMEPGAASRSYGIEVARYAGLPPHVIRRSREILANLEGGEFDERGAPRLARGAGEGEPTQLGLFEPVRSDPLREALRDIDPERMTAIEAMVELDRLKKLAEESS